MFTGGPPSSKTPLLIPLAGTAVIRGCLFPTQRCVNGWQAQSIECYLCGRDASWKSAVAPAFCSIGSSPHCLAYCATDFAQSVLDQLSHSVPDVHLKRVTLLCRTADDFRGMDAMPFDTVILNSVIQYFPSIEYLFRVLEDAVKVTAPGGSIFLGDVRSLPLAEAFHASVELCRAAAGTTAGVLRERVQKRAAQERNSGSNPFGSRPWRSACPSPAQCQLSSNADRTATR